MKTIIAILSIAIIACIAIIFWPSEPTQETQSLLNQRDSALLKANTFKVKYDSFEVKVKGLKAELLTSKAQVKRSEEKLTQAKVKERIHLKQIKELTLMMSDIQADSALKYRFRFDPDSIDQKVLFELARLDECDSIRQYQTSLIQSLHNTLSKSDSLLLLQHEMDLLSRNEISFLHQALSQDNKIFESKDKQIKRLRRQKRLAIIAIPVALILGLIVQ